MGLNEEIRALTMHNGINYFGVADLSLAKEAIVDQGGPEIAGFPYAISLGITLMHHIIDQLPRRAERSVAVNHRHHAYDTINQRLDITASIIAGYIQQKGYRVLPLPAAKRVNDEKICAAFSHKMGAYLAGLGWIGKSCLLVTPDYGPRARWISVLTDAPLNPTGSPMEEKCGSCTECVDICPVNAFTNRNFSPDEPREMRYNARKCEQYFDSMADDVIPAVCGMCMFACPYGRK